MTAKKNFLLTGGNPQRNLALGRQPSALTGWVERFMCGLLLESFVMKNQHTMRDYQFHALPGCLLWMIPAAHTVILLSESLLSPPTPIYAGLSCWTCSYRAKDWKWERRDWLKSPEKDKEGSGGQRYGRGEKWDNEAGGWTRGEWKDDREGRRVRDRSCRANRKHRERWKDGFDWINEKRCADRHSRAEVRDCPGRQKMWWK